MARYLEKDDSVKVLTNEAELKKYFDFRKTNDAVYEFATQDMRILDVVKGADILAAIMAAQYNIDPAVLTAEKVLAADDGTGLLGAFNHAWPDRELVCLPVMYTAMDGLQARSGLYGQTVNLREKSKVRVPLPFGERGKIYTSCLRTYTRKLNVLVRDDEIARIASEDYSPLDAEEGYASVKTYLEGNYLSVSMEACEITEEYLNVIFRTDERLVDLEDRLKKIGFDTDSIGLSFRFSTSDTTSSAMRIVPIIRITKDGMTTDLPLKGRKGEDVAVNHEDGNTVDDFMKIVDNRLALLVRDGEDAVERQGNTVIKDVAGCFQRLSEAFGGIAKGIREKKAADIHLSAVNGGAKSGLGLDVFGALMECISEQAKKKDGGVDVNSYIHLTEKAADWLRKDFREFDGAYKTPEKD